MSTDTALAETPDHDAALRAEIAAIVTGVDDRCDAEAIASVLAQKLHLHASEEFAIPASGTLPTTRFRSITGRLDVE